MSQGNTEIQNTYVDVDLTRTFKTPPKLDPTSPFVGDNSACNYIQYAGRPVIKALNGVVLCEPFKTNAIKKKERSGFATVEQKVALSPLMVLVGNTEVPAGSTVYVRAEACQMGWGKEIFESDTIPQFIRVPVTEIVFMKGYETNPYAPYTWLSYNTQGPISVGYQG